MVANALPPSPLHRRARKVPNISEACRLVQLATYRLQCRPSTQCSMSFRRQLLRSARPRMMGRIMAESFISTVATAALANFDTVLEHCGMSGGKDQGREYLALNPKRSDSKLGSLSTNRDTGAGGDFATGETWGDLVALVAWRFDCSQIDAADRLADLLGIQKPARRQRATGDECGAGNRQASAKPTKPASAPAKGKGSADTDGWACVQAIPPTAPPPPQSNPRQGRPKVRYTYRDSTGAVGFYIDRYEGKAGKSFAQLTYWQHKDGKAEWRWKSPPAPRLLFGLELLAASPAAPVLVCEGEKAAEAARLLFPGFVALSWPGGRQCCG